MTIINTSTSAFYERSNAELGSLRARAETMQQQISSETRLSRSSEDPVAASRLRNLSRADALSNIDMTNANRAATDLTLTDSAMSDVSSYIIKAKELATQAATGTLNDDQRASIGQQLTQMARDLVSLANSRDSSGHSLFGGEAAGDAYTIDGLGNATYAGTASSSELPLGDGQTIKRSVTGPEFLNFSVNGSPTDLMAVIKSLGDTLIGGAGDLAGAARDTLTALDTGLNTLTTAQTVVGSRLAWIDLTLERRTNGAELRANEEQQIGGTDLPATIASLQQTMLVLEASQASFTKLSNLSLFNLLN